MKTHKDILQTRYRLHEELLLMMIDQEGFFYRSLKNVSKGLNAALMLELTLMSRIKTEQGAIQITDASSTGDELLDEALLTLHHAGTPQNFTYWVRKLNIRHLKKRLILRLVEQNVLRKVPPQLASLEFRTTYPPSSPADHADLRRHLHAVVFRDIRANERDAARLILTRLCNLVEAHFSKPIQGEARRLIATMMTHGVIGISIEPLRDVVAEAFQGAESGHTGSSFWEGAGSGSSESSNHSSSYDSGGWGDSSGGFDGGGGGGDSG